MEPLINGASTRLTSFIKEHTQMSEMIRRFDEVISNKVNKVALFDLEKKIRETYLKKTRIEEIEDNFLSIKKMLENKLEEVNRMNAELKRTFTAQMNQTIEELATNKLEKYDRIANEFNKFFNQDELMKIINSKVDREDVERLTNKKAGKLEFNTSLDLIENLYSRIKHMSVMILEVTKVLLPGNASSSIKAGENINTKIYRRNQLMRQAEASCKWVSDF